MIEAIDVIDEAIIAAIDKAILTARDGVEELQEIRLFLKPRDRINLITFIVNTDIGSAKSIQ